MGLCWAGSHGRHRAGRGFQQPRLAVRKRHLQCRGRRRGWPWRQVAGKRRECRPGPRPAGCPTAHHADVARLGRSERGGRRGACVFPPVPRGEDAHSLCRTDALPRHRLVPHGGGDRPGVCGAAGEAVAARRGGPWPAGPPRARDLRGPASRGRLRRALGPRPRREQPRRGRPGAEDRDRGRWCFRRRASLHWHRMAPRLRGRGFWQSTGSPRSVHFLPTPIQHSRGGVVWLLDVRPAHLGVVGACTRTPFEHGQARCALCKGSASSVAWELAAFWQVQCGAVCCRGC
mmetsp:Transcript_27204/g.78419  ORF Transcript_27204/g.78419 Transcript_27204/m.78419 type:complete len:288 (+) Transcript_27204:410-1273(+)